MQSLFEKYNNDGFEIAAFPCNQFGSQEPWDNAEIKKWVKETFGVTFDMFAKINVNGDDAIPLYKYLKHKQGGTLGDFIKWNFTQFLIDRNGVPVARYAPTSEPNKAEPEIAKLLGVSKK